LNHLKNTIECNLFLNFNDNLFYSLLSNGTPDKNINLYQSYRRTLDNDENFKFCCRIVIFMENYKKKYDFNKKKKQFTQEKEKQILTYKTFLMLLF
jgi:hypothetical protein